MRFKHCVFAVNVREYVSTYTLVYIYIQTDYSGTHVIHNVSHGTIALSNRFLLRGNLNSKG